MRDVIVIGGGLAGLVSAIQLAKGGLKVLLIEKKTYPTHRVCGEYISNEVLPFLQGIGFDPYHHGAATISRLQVTTTSGRSLELPLSLGGFGLSRFTIDFQLYNIAKLLGVEFLLNTQVENVLRSGDTFKVLLPDLKEFEAKLVLGCFGKRSNLDRQLNRSFFKKKSPYLGVKYHVKTHHPKDLISLHIFKNGYCGISKVENDTFCLCYLTERTNLKISGTIEEMEKKVLSENPFLQKIFNNSDFVFETPEVINEISFDEKTTSERSILMVGDSVGMISPLCGNGMAMAIHSAKIASDILLENWSSQALDFQKIEEQYRKVWNSIFRKRLYAGRKIQEVFGNELLSSASVFLLDKFKGLGKRVIDLTHGKTFL